MNMKKTIIITLLLVFLFLHSCIIIDDDKERARIYVYNRNAYELTLDIDMNGNKMFTLAYGQTGTIRDVPQGVHTLQAWWWNPYYQEWELEAEIQINVVDRGDYFWEIL